MRLEVGITHLLPEWEIIIQQIGLPFEIITLNESILTDQFSVIIVTRREAKFQKDVLLHYFNSGGSILTEADVAEWLFNIDTVLAYVDTIEADDDPIYNGILPGFIQTKLLLPRKAEMLASMPSRKSEGFEFETQFLEHLFELGVWLSEF